MRERLRIVGIVLATLGLILVGVGGFAYLQVQDGYGSLAAFSEAQNVTLSYNEDGQLIDRGTTEGAAAIMALLTEDWGYRVVESDLDPNDPLVNTASEYMFMMATIGYHVLHGDQTVVLTEDVTYNDVTYAAGTYEVPVDGRYWTDFDRRHPLEGPVRAQAWTGVVHGLFAELGVGTVTHSALQLGTAVAAALAAIGFMGIVGGAGLIWASRARREEIPAVPDTVPEDLIERSPA